MKETGSVIFKMALAKKLGLMDRAMKGTINKGRKMEKVKHSRTRLCSNFYIKIDLIIISHAIFKT